MNERERAYVLGVSQGHGSATGDQRMLAILTREIERVANALESKEIEAAARYLLPAIERVAVALELERRASTDPAFQQRPPDRAGPDAEPDA